MSALGGSEDFDDNFREVVIDRIILHIEHLNGDELLSIAGKCIELRLNNGSLPV